MCIFYSSHTYSLTSYCRSLVAANKAIKELFKNEKERCLRRQLLQAFHVGPDPIADIEDKSCSGGHYDVCTCSKCSCCTICMKSCSCYKVEFKDIDVLRKKFQPFKHEA